MLSRPKKSSNCIFIYILQSDGNSRGGRESDVDNNNKVSSCPAGPPGPPGPPGPQVGNQAIPKTSWLSFCIWNRATVIGLFQ